MPTPRLAVGKAIVPSFSRIDTEAERQQYRLRLFELWGVTPSLRFPGSNPRSVSRAALPQLHMQPQLISLKSDGVRYLLMLTLRPGNSGPVALMIDRAWNMYEVEVLAPEAYFVNGTLLEGELVWRQPEDGTLLYLIFDAIASQGRNLTKMPFTGRLAELRRCTATTLEHLEYDELERTVLEMDVIVITHYAPRITMRAKSFVASMHAERLWRERGDTDHRVDGIIFNENAAPYRCGAATAVYKWKPHSTVDLTLDEADQLRCSDGHLPPMLHGRTVCLQPSKLAPSSAGEVTEYLVTTTPTTVLLFPLRRRLDKTNANSERVVLATISDVLEDVTVQELSDSSGPVQGTDDGQRRA